MTTAAIKRALVAMTSGECRWIGREDVHVYCRSPLNQGRTYRVVTADRDYEGQPWIEAEAALAVIKQLVS